MKKVLLFLTVLLFAFCMSAYADRVNYETKNLFTISKAENSTLISTPKVIDINVDNYQGIITIKSLFSNKIEWFLDGAKIKTKYNLSGLFTTDFSVKNLTGKHLSFKL